MDDFADDRTAFLRMAREFPVRTGIFTFGLPAFAALQLINGLVHEGSLAVIGLFTVIAVAYSMLLTKYHLAAYRRRRLANGWADDE